MDDEDRISELPEQILHHHILSLLPQEQAVRTCTLSKSWRHLGPTRPKIEFHESDFPESKEIFLSVVENTLQRYDEQKLSVQEFVLSMLEPCSSSNSNSLVNKWIVKLHMLKHLSLHHIHIEDETFENIMSSCPSIQHLVLDSCSGLSSVKVNKARNLKHFVCEFLEENCSVEISDDAPSLETIRIVNYQKRFHLHTNNKNYFFPRLKSLFLWEVHLQPELLKNLSSNNSPCLEDLELRYCSGFTEFELSSRSIKRLIIDLPDYPLTKVAIDAANMQYFEFASGHLPSNVSFATTSSEWRSNIFLSRSSDDFLSSTWSLELHEFLKALSQSRISLVVPPYLPELTNQDTNNDCEPVVVEHLCLMECCSSSQIPTLLNCLFRICRPRYKGLSLYSYTQIFRESQDLEGSSIQVCGGNHPSKRRDLCLVNQILQ